MYIFSKQPLRKLLVWLLYIVAHKTLEVKLHGLKRLHSELSVQQSEVTKLILSSDNVNSIIIKVIDAWYVINILIYQSINY